MNTGHRSGRREQGPPRDDLFLRTARYGAAAVAVGDAAYVLGGSGPKGLCEEVERVDPRGRSVNAVPGVKLLPRRYAGAAALGEDVYVVGGAVAPRLLPTDAVERWNVRTGKVTRLRPLPTPRAYLGLVADPRRRALFAVGGVAPDGARVGTLEIYDVATDTWSPAPSMPTAREGHAVLWAGRVLVIGGYGGAEPLRAAEAYEISERRWRKLPALPAPLSAHRPVVVGDRLYTFGDYRELNRTLACDLRTMAWRRIDLGYQHARHAAGAALPGGRIVVAGGNTESSNSNLDLVQVFDVGA